MCGADRVVFGPGLRCSALPNQRACRIVTDVPPCPAVPRRVFWKTSDRVFRLDPFDTDPAAV
jgi:hypothetical protein